MSIERRRLLARVREAPPRLTAFIAPAGFGKSAAALQYAETFSSFSVCDCSGLSSERDFVRRLIGARSAAATPDGNVAQIQFSLSDAGGAGDDDVEPALQAWSSGLASTAVIFDNVEALGDNAALRRLFERALVATPESCKIIACSRTPLRIQASRVAPPHRIVTLRAEELAFDLSEITGVFAGVKVSKRHLDRIATVTRGWPIGVLMLRRLADEGNLERPLSHLDDFALDDMHAYLADEVFALLDPRQRDAVIACAAFGTAQPSDIALALGCELESDAADLLRSVNPLATAAADGSFSVHPLLEAAIERRYRTERVAYAAGAAQRLEAQHRYLAAARVLHRLGERDQAARMLFAEASVPSRKPSAEFASLLATLDADTLAQYPVLRGLMTYAQRFRVDPHRLREETRAIWQTIRHMDFQLRCNVGNPLARIMYETGRFEEAEALLRALEAEAGGIAEVPRNAGEAYIARTLGCVLARSGRLAEAESYFRRGYINFPGAEFVMSRAAIERAVIERMHGRLDRERRLFDQAIELAVAQKASVHIACALAESSFGAWLAGDDALALNHARQLEECMRRDAMRGFAHFCAVSFGDAEASQNGTEQPNWLACAELMACAASCDKDRVRHAEAASKAADESSDRYLQLLGSIALAYAKPAERSEHLAQALMHAAAIDAPPLRAAVAALVADQPDIGTIASFISRFTANPADAHEAVRIDVLSQSVFRGGIAVALPQRELAVLVALARQRKHYPRSEIASLVWPDLDDDAAREAFNSCLYRLRQRLPGIVSYGREGYRLHERVRVDLRELEHWVASLTLRRPLREQERFLYSTLHERLRQAAMPDDEAGTWDWLAPIFLRLDDMRRSVAERLANDALRRADYDQALKIARLLVTDDTCDEMARELAIKAHLGLGRRGEAIREFRQYRTVLQRELQAEPSSKLAALLHEPPARARSVAEAS